MLSTKNEMTSFFACLFLGILSVAWVEINNIHPMVFNQRGLVSLKLIGTGLKTLPKEIGTNLNSLTCLSVANNCLTTLPDRCVTTYDLVTQNRHTCL